MIAFGSGSSAGSTAATAAREAARQALAQMKGQTPALAIVFASPSYADVEAAARAVRDVVGDAQIVGGTAAGAVFDGHGFAARGVSVVLVGGDAIEVESRTAALAPPSYMEAVPVAERIAKRAHEAASRGLAHFACLVLAPSARIDGDALVAAVRKGAGAHAQLAGGVTGEDQGAPGRSRVFFGDELRDDCAVLTGLFTKGPVGIAARHGGAPVGATHVVTRTEDTWVVEIDERPALDVWLEDVRAAGGEPPSDRSLVARYLADRYGLGIAAEPPAATSPQDAPELVVRAPFDTRDDGALLLSASIAEGTAVRVIGWTRADVLRASREAATAAATRAGGGPVAGALVLACTGRLHTLGEAFAEEPMGAARTLEASVGGACVHGEIARTLRDTEAFFNMTAVVIAFPAGP
ncbi:MAG: hypothetical protein JWP97_313 [Labilithrix sp.]|nr:hypothetical protein [Labilithrix sp.]